MMKLKKIHHIAIICSNYEKSKEFYTQILGLTPKNEVNREERNSYKMDLEVNGHYQIESFSFPNPPERPSFPEAVGLRHLAFEVDQVEEAVRELVRKGIEVEAIREDEITKKRYTFFADPDGLPIELYEK